MEVMERISVACSVCGHHELVRVEGSMTSNICCPFCGVEYNEQVIKKREKEKG
jgi:hypothetical protein